MTISKIQIAHKDFYGVKYKKMVDELCSLYILKKKENPEFENKNIDQGHFYYLLGYVLRDSANKGDSIEDIFISACDELIKVKALILANTFDEYVNAKIEEYFG